MGSKSVVRYKFQRAQCSLSLLPLKENSCSHILQAGIYEGLKHVVGWRRKKLKKDHGFVKCRVDMSN